VYKPIYLEAQGAAAVALYLRAGQNVPSELTNGTTLDGTKNVPSVLLTPTWVTKDNMASTVVKDKAVNGTQLCVSAVAAACAAAGIS
jgi:D-xylose transport system substrate-binding protein